MHSTDSSRTGRSLTIGGFELRRSDGLVLLAAVAVGVIGAVSYYSDALRSLAHSYLIWLLLVAVAAARQTPLRGALRGGIGLLVSVVAFYVGKQLLYDVIYGSGGLPYRVGADELLLWGGLGLIGGAGLGLAASGIGRAGWIAAGSTAVAVALMAVEAWQRFRDYGDILPAAVALGGTVAVVALGDRSVRQLIRTGYLLVPALLTVSVILDAPDGLQRFLRW